MDSSRTPDRESTPDVEHYISDKLKGALFSGWYTERIWIDDLKTYRDQIKIDEDELQIGKILKSVNRRVKKLRPGFTGIERTNDQFSIYVDWSNQTQIIGHYWFLLENVILGPQHLDFHLRIIRPVTYNDKSGASGRCPHCGKLPVQDCSTQDDPLSLSDVARQLQGKFQDIIKPSQWWTDTKPHLTFDNVFKFGKFIIVLLLAAVSGTGNFIIHMASHTNRFVHALSGLMRSTTPFLLACIDAVNRVFAGFFTLLAMIWRDVRRGPSPSPQETANRLAFERNEAKRKYLEGPNYPYRREVNRPYL